MKSWYAQKRQVGSSKIPSFDELQIIRLEYDDALEIEVDVPEIEAIDAPIQGPASGIIIFFTRRRVSMRIRTSPTVGEKGKNKSFKGSSSEAIFKDTITQEERSRFCSKR